MFCESCIIISLILLVVFIFFVCKIIFLNDKFYGILGLQMNMSRTGVYGLARKGDKILLVVQARGPYANRFDFPGGKIEFGETIEQALHREFIEEVGMDFDSMRWVDNLTATVGTFHHIGLIYEVTGLRFLKNSGDLTHDWVDIVTLTEDKVSPFVWAIFQK